MQLSKQEYAIKRIHNGCSVQIENSITWVTVRHHSASLMMLNSYPRDGIFIQHLTSIKDFYNLVVLQTIYISLCLWTSKFCLWTCICLSEKQIKIFDFCSVRSNFISPNEHQKQYFYGGGHKWKYKFWCSWVNASFSVHEWNKIQSYTEKSKFSVSFMLLFTIIKLLPAFRLSHQKANFFSSHFMPIWSCSLCLGGMILGENAVLHLENEPT